MIFCSPASYSTGGQHSVPPATSATNWITEPSGCYAAYDDLIQHNCQNAARAWQHTQFNRTTDSRLNCVPYQQKGEQSYAFEYESTLSPSSSVSSPGLCADPVDGPQPAQVYHSVIYDGSHQVSPASSPAAQFGPLNDNSPNPLNIAANYCQPDYPPVQSDSQWHDVNQSAPESAANFALADTGSLDDFSSYQLTPIEPVAQQQRQQVYSYSQPSPASSSSVSIDDYLHILSEDSSCSTLDFDNIIDDCSSSSAASPSASAGVDSPVAKRPAAGKTRCSKRAAQRESLDERKREQNALSANRYRSKTRAQRNQLSSELERLARRNRDLERQLEHKLIAYRELLLLFQQSLATEWTYDLAQIAQQQLEKARQLAPDRRDIWADFHFL